MKTRAIDNSDIWAAIRGIGIARMSEAELGELESVHRDIDLFASRVIVAAISGVRAMRRASWPYGKHYE